MILNWSRSRFSPVEQLLGVLFDTGVLRRNDLSVLLECSERNLRYRITLARKDGLIQRFHHRDEVVYGLSDAGMKHVKTMLGLSGKVESMSEQIVHQLAINDILLRYVKRVGRDGIAEWYSTREATDELIAIRTGNEESERDIRSTMIKPDAMALFRNAIAWIEFDNNTESTNQLAKKYYMYIRNFKEIADTDKTVVWVTPNEKRRKHLERIWTKYIRGERNETQMHFFVAGAELKFLYQNFGMAAVASR